MFFCLFVFFFTQNEFIPAKQHNLFFSFSFIVRFSGCDNKVPQLR